MTHCHNLMRKIHTSTMGHTFDVYFDKESKVSDLDKYFIDINHRFDSIDDILDENLNCEIYVTYDAYLKERKDLHSWIVYSHERFVSPSCPELERIFFYKLNVHIDLYDRSKFVLPFRELFEHHTVVSIDGDKFYLKRTRNFNLIKEIPHKSDNWFQIKYKCDLSDFSKWKGNNRC